ncbi:unnamed protein product, partial [Effrenium voratum]
ERLVAFNQEASGARCGLIPDCVQRQAAENTAESLAYVVGSQWHKDRKVRNREVCVFAVLVELGSGASEAHAVHGNT